MRYSSSHAPPRLDAMNIDVIGPAELTAFGVIEPGLEPRRSGLELDPERHRLVLRPHGPRPVDSPTRSRARRDRQGHACRIGAVLAPVLGGAERIGRSASAGQRRRVISYVPARSTATPQAPFLASPWRTCRDWSRNDVLPVAGREQDRVLRVRTHVDRAELVDPRRHAAPTIRRSAPRIRPTTSGCAAATFFVWPGSARRSYSSSSLTSRQRPQSTAASPRFGSGASIRLNWTTSIRSGSRSASPRSSLARLSPSNRAAGGLRSPHRSISVGQQVLAGGQLADIAGRPQSARRPADEAGDAMAAVVEADLLPPHAGVEDRHARRAAVVGQEDQDRVVPQRRSPRASPRACRRSRRCWRSSRRSWRRSAAGGDRAAR